MRLIRQEIGITTIGMDKKKTFHLKESKHLTQYTNRSNESYNFSNLTMSSVSTNNIIEYF